MEKLVDLLCLSSCCLVITVRLFLTMPRVCLQFVIVVFLDHAHLLFLVFQLTEGSVICILLSSMSAKLLSRPRN